ncbi:hypothetical protein HNR56_000243 [Roseospira marina]|nr:hypothetical protein [Roseospira marina]MBB5085571.1 hypothetical protein [Roseospira marina]
MNRAIGAATQGLSRHEGVEYLFALPVGGVTLDDAA